MKISVIIPVYQGENTIAPLVEELVEKLAGNPLEIILVNDGSQDKSHEICAAIFKKYKGIVKYLNLSKNFGEHNAVLAGLNYAEGGCAVIIDDDFQNPPEEIQTMVDKLIEGKYDAVYSYYSRKHHSWFRNLGSAFNNMVSTCLLKKPRGLYLSSFKCINRFAINEIIKYKGPYPYIDGLVLRSTRNIGQVLVRHEKRMEGKSGYTLKKLIRLWLNMFINFSIFPLRLSTFLGLAFSVLGILSAGYLIVDKLAHPEIPVGITSILVAILIFAGIQLTMLGLIGEYIGKQFLASNQTPQYVIREIYSNDTKEG